jgi:hypothetical protein
VERVYPPRAILLFSPAALKASNGSSRLFFRSL